MNEQYSINDDPNQVVQTTASDQGLHSLHYKKKKKINKK